MKFSLVLASLAALSAGPIMAQTPMAYVENGDALFSIDVPDFWTVRTGGVRSLSDGRSGDARLVSRVVGLQPENDDSAWMGFVSPPGVDSLSAGQRYLSDISKHLVSDADVTNTRMTRIGGRTAEVFSGTGNRAGRAIQFTAAVIDLPGPRVAVAIAIHARNANLSYVPDMNAVFASFRAE